MFEQYLGLPLSLRKLTRDQFQPIIDRIADQLPALMTRAGRVVQVQHVLTAMLIYPLIFLLGQSKPSTRSEGVLSGEGARIQKGVIALLHGLRCAVLRSWEVLGFLT
jgi:hypothetical protein